MVLRRDRVQGWAPAFEGKRAWAGAASRLAGPAGENTADIDDIDPDPAEGSVRQLIEREGQRMELIDNILAGLGASLDDDARYLGAHGLRPADPMVLIVLARKMIKKSLRNMTSLTEVIEQPGGQTSLSDEGERSHESKGTAETLE
jgi:hypothetical protein